MSNPNSEPRRPIRVKRRTGHREQDRREQIDSEEQSADLASAEKFQSTNGVRARNRDEQRGCNRAERHERAVSDEGQEALPAFVHDWSTPGSC